MGKKKDLKLKNKEMKNENKKLKKRLINVSILLGVTTSILLVKNHLNKE